MRMRRPESKNTSSEEREDSGDKMYFVPTTFLLIISGLSVRNSVRAAS